MTVLSRPEHVSTSDRIAKTAASLFAEKGYASVSMREIANAVGIKAASLYNHFDDKESLYRAALAHAFSNHMTEMERAMSTGGSPNDRLLATLIAMARSNEADQISSKLLWRELLDGDQDRQQWLADNIFRRPFRLMSGLLEETIPDESGELTASYLSALVMGYYALAPIIERLAGEGFVAGPEIFGRDIAQRLAGRDQEAAP